MLEHLINNSMKAPLHFLASSFSLFAVSSTLSAVSSAAFFNSVSNSCGQYIHQLGQAEQSDQHKAYTTTIQLVTFAAVWKLLTVFPSSLPSSGSFDGPVQVKSAELDSAYATDT